MHPVEAHGIAAGLGGQNAELLHQNLPQNLVGFLGIFLKGAHCASPSLARGEFSQGAGSEVLVDKRSDATSLVFGELKTRSSGQDVGIDVKKEKIKFKSDKNSPEVKLVFYLSFEQ
jgi:hypothetical protein